MVYGSEDPAFPRESIDQYAKNHPDDEGCGETETTEAALSQTLPPGSVLPALDGLEETVRRYSVLHKAVSVVTELFPPVVREAGFAEPE
jgi:hypothetical protein